MDFIVVSRHPALVQYLRERGVLTGREPVVSHASPEDVRGKVVVGVLPLRLAAEAAEVWEVPLELPPELRGRELTLEQVRRCAGPLTRYRVQILAGETPAREG